MNKRQPALKESIQLVTIIALGAFFLVGNNVPIQALHKEEQALNKFDNLKDFADAVKKRDESKLLENDIPLLSLKASDIYKDADQQTQDCIDLAGKIGKNLGDQEIVHCSEDPNFYQNQISSNNNNNNNNSPDNTGN